MPSSPVLALELKILTLVTGTVVILALGNYLYSNGQSVPTPTPLSSLNASAFVDSSRSANPILQTNTEDEDDDGEPTYRLPKNLIPIKYVLKLQPVLPLIPEAYAESGENPLDGLTLFSIPGQVNITFRCDARTDKIVLHQVGISVWEDGVKVWKYDIAANEILPGHNNGSSVPVIRHSYDTKQDFYTITLGETLERGELYTVFIPFTSFLSRLNTVGIFAVDYTDPLVNRTKHMVSTKFQATHARQGFPCFDEPEFKATFETILGRTRGYHSLSNWPLRETLQDEKGWYWDHFEPTVQMSVYLVCIAISDFTSQDAEVPLRGNRPVKVWAPKHIIDKGGGRYGANLTSKVITMLEDYFDMPDLLPKVDSVMVPGLLTPAMENWGLITYKEDMIIYTPEDSIDRYVIVTTVVAHELSHHWFGNLVTCEWWSDIWLNEGFATFLSYMIMDGLELNHNPEHMFIENVLQFTMTSDSQPSVKPVKAEAKTPTEVYDMFGTTSYRKGASLIRMVQNFVGPDNFRAALQNFMRKFAFKTANQDDLFEELNQVCDGCLPPGVTVKDVMDTWTLQPGYPNVRVDRLNETTIRLTQQPFSLSLGEHDTTEERRWWIPLKLTTQSQPVTDQFIWMAPNVTSLTLVINSSRSEDEWLQINSDYAGYFSITYDLKSSVLLQDQLERNHTVFSPVSRCQILFDHVGAAKANLIPGEAVLNVTRYLDEETNPLPWTSLYFYFHDLQRYLRMSKEHIDSFTRYMIPKLEKILESPEVGMQGKEGEPFQMDHFRFSLLRIACRFGSEKCFDEARRIFRNWIDNSEKPFENYKNGAEDVLRCAMVRAVGTEAWQYMLNKFLTSRDRSTHWLALRAVSCVQTEELISRTLDLCANTTVLADSMLRTGVLSNLLRNKNAAMAALDFILNHVQLNGTDPLDTSKFIHMDDFATLLTSISEYPCGIDIIEKLRHFAEENKSALEGTSVVKDAIHTMDEFATWMEHYGQIYLDWFNNNAAS